MEKLTLTALRRNVFRVVDRVLETGIPRGGRTSGQNDIADSSSHGAKGFPAKKRRKLIGGDPRLLVSVKVGQLREPRKLK